jgi:hypothetical protein
MKKLLVFVALIWILFFTNVAGAIPWTWTATVDPADNIFFSSKGTNSYAFSLNIAGDGFVVGEDHVDMYSLAISLYDDNDRAGEMALINLPGILSDGLYNFSFIDNIFGMSVTGWIQLNATGTLDVVINRLWGDFFFDSAILTATGDDAKPVSVPEPSTLLLLGTGLFALGLYGRLRSRPKG